MYNLQPLYHYKMKRQDLRILLCVEYKNNYKTVYTVCVWVCEVTAIYLREAAIYMSITKVKRLC